VSIATGAGHVHVADQIARDAVGNPVATGDLVGQVAYALRNSARGLAGAGASFADVVRLRFSRRGRAGIPRRLPLLSAFGADYLFGSDVLVEVEACAVLG
jgi:hypothetical protein